MKRNIIHGSRTSLIYEVIDTFKVFYFYCYCCLFPIYASIRVWNNTWFSSVLWCVFFRGLLFIPFQDVLNVIFHPNWVLKFLNLLRSFVTLYAKFNRLNSLSVSAYTFWIDFFQTLVFWKPKHLVYLFFFIPRMFS